MKFIEIVSSGSKLHDLCLFTSNRIFFPLQHASFPPQHPSLNKYLWNIYLVPRIVQSAMNIINGVILFLPLRRNEVYLSEFLDNSNSLRVPRVMTQGKV